MRKPAGGDVTLLGDLRTVRGYYQFQGRRFELVDGSQVRFRAGSPINPALDVTAEREISGVTARVRVGGSMRDPALTLSSDPPLDQGDILSLIIFNQPINQLGASQRGALGQKAADMAAGAIATPIADSVARALNVDLFEIQPSGANGAPSVSLGNQFGSLYVGIRHQFGSQEANELTVEYRLTDALRLVTSVAQGVQQTQLNRRGNSSGVDLIYVIRY